ncbi:MAG: creatinine amidohydrolase [Thermomicrobiales bacterium]|nr:creatinine amidohydrolase [Thermomicrobiales bacterium]
MTERARRVSHLTWGEFQERASDAVVLLPVGALEQHGLHLPLDTDTCIAVGLADRVAAQLDGLVLPPLAYGARSLPRSGGGDGFPGTTNLDGATLISLVRDVVREQHRHGVRRFVALLGHGENDPFVVEGVHLAVREIGDPGLHALVIGWWHVVPAEALAPLFPEGFPGWDLEHAARIETALMLALDPDRVREDLIGPVDAVVAPPYTAVPSPPGMVPKQGSLAAPTGATRAAGEALVELTVRGLASTIADRFGISSS